MNLGWVDYSFPVNGINQGYRNAAEYLHYAARAATRMLGGTMTDGLPNAPAHPRVQLHVCPPHIFRPIRGKLNVLYSMWESPSLPPEVAACLGKADAWMVPSQFNVAVWKGHGADEEKVFWVPLGLPHGFLNQCAGLALLDTKYRGGDKPRFLYLGSNIMRKGWHTIAPAWNRVMSHNPHFQAQLYVKFQGDGAERKERVEAYGGDIIIDSRYLSEAEITDLYLSSDAFLFPTRGEGFGLPVLEAMTAGCLIVAPSNTAISELIDSNSAILIPQSTKARYDYGVSWVDKAHTVEDVGEGISEAMALLISRGPRLVQVRNAAFAKAASYTVANTIDKLRVALDSIGRVR